MRSAPLLLLTACAVAGEAPAIDLAAGLRTYAPVNPDPALANPWPAAWESGLQQRFAGMVAAHHGAWRSNSWGENEKRAWAGLSWRLLAGDRSALAEYARPDQQPAEMAHTGGIDLWHGYALKWHVVFQGAFRRHMEPDFLARFDAAVASWTEQDPLTRPHPLFGRGDGSEDAYDPKSKGFWIDGRATDGFRSYRVAAIGTLAEAAGRGELARTYHTAAQDYARSCYHSGKGEWESSNYLGYNLSSAMLAFDYLRDPASRRASKLVLDWIAASAALKWFHGSLAGGSLRDFGNAYRPWSHGAAEQFSAYFDDPMRPEAPAGYRYGSYDASILLLSQWRPPEAVVRLARGEYPTPIEVRSVKPAYGVWSGGPLPDVVTRETFFRQDRYVVASAQTEAPGDGGNPRLMRISVRRGDGSLFITGINRTNPLGGGRSLLPMGFQAGQRRNLVVAMGAGGDDALWIGLPTGEPDAVGGVLVWDLGGAWLALGMDGLRLAPPEEVPPEPPTADPASDREIRKEADAARRSWRERHGAILDLRAAGLDNRRLVATATGPWTVAVQVASTADFADAAAFRRALAADWSLQRNGTEAAVVGAGGGRLDMAWKGGADWPAVRRDGVPEDWSDEWVWRVIEGEPVIEQRRGSGTLTVRAGGATFTGTMPLTGEAAWTNTPAAP